MSLLGNDIALRQACDVFAVRELISNQLEANQPGAQRPTLRSAVSCNVTRCDRLSSSRGTPNDRSAGSTSSHRNSHRNIHRPPDLGQNHVRNHVRSLGRHLGRHRHHDLLGPERLRPQLLPRYRWWQERRVQPGSPPPTTAVGCSALYLLSLSFQPPSQVTIALNTLQ